MSRSLACRRSAAGLLCALGAGLAYAGPAAAAAPDQTWNCRASAAYTAVPARDRDEPVVANGSSRTATESPDRARCADDEAKPVGVGAELGVQGPAAATAIAPDTGLAVDQRVSARSSVADFAPSQDGFALVVHGASAEASGACSPAGAGLSGSSTVPEARLNGQELDTSQAKQTVSQLPTGGTVTISFNEQTRSGGVLTQRAVHVEFRDRLGNVVKEIVAAEARVAGGSQVCDRAAQEATGGGNGDGSGSGSGSGSQPCINGAEYDAAHNLCIITRERDHNLSDGRETVAIVGRPYEGPSGGRVAPPSEAPKSVRTSTCVKGKGVKFVVLGTKRADRITGSNRADLIFTFGGNDRVSGGRGNDCIVGGRGNDRLAGAQGKDTLIGGRGGDNLNGGSEADRLIGGAGRDSINAAYGRDRVSGGKGADAINVATAGPAARVNCGSGRDVVRSNRNERRRLHGCERRYSIR
jgi:hypothetical protein